MVFNLDKQALQDIGAVHTVSEILQQPTTWLKTFELVKGLRQEIKEFIDELTGHGDFRIIFTGAGTSEFVGNSLVDHFRKLYGNKVESIASTSIVSQPDLYLSKQLPTMLVSFARSGNSPESMGAVHQAETICDHLYHLVITCNDQGQLAQFKSEKSKLLAINLPPETNDQSLAMTSSFSNMYLAAYLALNIDRLDALYPQVSLLVSEANNFFSVSTPILEEFMNQQTYSRVVYLGSNYFKGIAQECALKMLELTSGQVATFYDTGLGFRHGPKSFLNESTLTVLFTSGRPYPTLYEHDLFKQLPKDVMVFDNGVHDLYADASLRFVYDKTLDDGFAGLMHLLAGQVLGVLSSLKAGLKPDSPSPSGLISRVVQGVTLYEYEGE